MQNISSGEVIALFFGGIVFFLAGLVFFIIGLANKKQKMFITGLCIFIVGLVSIILGAGFGIFKLAGKIKNESEKNQPFFDQTFQNPGSPPVTYEAVTPAEKNSVTGYLVDEDGKEVYCKVEAGKNFLSNGICLEKLQKTDAGNPSGKEIQIYFSFGSRFLGFLKLTAYNLQSAEAGSSAARVEARPGCVLGVTFLFPKTFVFKNISYFKIEAQKVI